MEDQNEILKRLRHSAAHVLARAVLESFPEAHLGIGPPTTEGFYYDFDLPRPLTESDLSDIEERMRRIIREGDPFVFRQLTEEEARELFKGQPYKLELIEQILSGSGDEYGERSDERVALSTYRLGPFEDLCRGPHVNSTAEIDADALRLLRVSGAYWRGDENRSMLQRVYGTVWRSRDELEAYLQRLDEFKLRDHRKLGEDLQLFVFDSQVGKGLPLWLPNGTIVRDLLEEWAKETERRLGYERVSSPHIAKAALFETSGHLPHFEDELYAPIEIEDDKYYLKPVNCPFHLVMFKSRPRSYRELPMRYAEYGTVYRYEKSGELHGLLRVRGMTQNDAHIFCTIDQAKQEFLDVMRLHAFYYEALGITDFHMVLALRDPVDREKYHPDEGMWVEAERLAREAMQESEIPFVEELGGAAHYAPKVDFIIRSATGKEFAASTNQLDLYMPMRFDLSFINSQGARERPVVIHRAPLGSHERFVGFLIEHFKGAFPLWLAPIQTRVIPLSRTQEELAETISMNLSGKGFRSEVDPSGESLSSRIRRGELEKIPFLLVCGPLEERSATVSVRARGLGDLGQWPVERLVAHLEAKTRDKSLVLYP